MPLDTAPLVTIPAFLEQSDVASPPPPPAHFLSSDFIHSLSSSCSLHKPFFLCCPALDVSLYFAFAPTTLSLPAATCAARSFPLRDLSNLLDDPKSCAEQVDLALVARSVHLPCVNDTCDAAYCYYGIRCRRLTCAGSDVIAVDERAGRWEVTMNAGRRLQ